MELDVLAWKRKMKINSLRYMVNDFSCVGHMLGLSLLNSANAVIDHPFLKVSSIAYDLYELPILYTKFRKNAGTIFDLIEELKNTDSYKMCYEKYNDYILKISSFLKKIGISDGLEACIYITNALRLGYFSKDKKCVYKKYRNDPLYTSHVLGARVLQGEYVCRHASFFLNSILENLNYDVAMVSVKLTNKAYSKLSSFELSTFNTNHAVSVILDEYGKFVFDITNFLFARCTEKENQFDIVSGFEDQYFLFDDGVEYLDDDCPLYMKIRNSKNMDLSLKDIILSKCETYELMAATQRDLDNFYNENKDTVLEIASLEEQIAPRSNRLIKKWIVK